MSHSRRFVTNVIWNWTGVAASLFTGLILSPIIIRRLGPDGYGVWALSFAMMDYYWFFDFGFRSATVKYVAHYTATGENNKVGEVISTSIIYAGLMAAVVLAIVALSVGKIVEFFKVAPGLRHDFAVVILLVASTWAAGLVLGLAGIALEAVQRFDITSRIGVFSTAFRAVIQATLLFRGYGLVPLAIATVLSWMLGHALNVISFRKVFPRVPISLKMASTSTLRKLSGFGIHSFLINTASAFQIQSAPVLIGHFMPAAFSGYYNLPMRLIQYTAEFVGRIGSVTNATAAEFSARGDSDSLKKLPIYTNRFCLVFFAPLAIIFYAYGLQFFELWVGPKAAPLSAAVLPILLTGYMIGVIGQYSSSMLLLGTGQHQTYARGMVVELIADVALLIVVIPRYGIVGAAWVATAMMIVNRGVYLSYIASRNIGLSFTRYVLSIYAAPVLSAIPAVALAVVLKSTILPGRNLWQLGAAGVLISLAVYPIAFFTCLEPQHRRLVYDAVAQRFSKGTTETAG